MRTAVFSIISPNYRHFARALMGSMRRHHPEWDRFVLHVGGAPDPACSDEPFTTVPLETLPLPHARRFCFRYTLLELDTAVKPWMFEHLFARGYDRVVYLDPDVFVYSPLAELDAAPPETFLTLTPHLTGFIGGDDFPSERTVLQAGTFNLGFLAVIRQPPLPAFLSWWQGKLEHQCVVDPARGLFVDQKWMDLAPGLFPGVTILRHEGYNVAYWNLEHRAVVRTGSGTTVNGQPLRFFHFSGFDPALGKRVSKHHHALGLEEVGDVRGLIEEYRAALLAAGCASFRNAPYAFGAFADGTPIPDAARLAYRESPELQAKCGDDPFAHPELFLGIRDAPKRPPRAARAGVASYRFLSRARPLVGLIPRPARTAMREFLLGRREGRSVRPASAATLPPGLNVVGYLSRDSGVGESARACRRACEAAGLPFHLVDVDAPFRPRAVHRSSIHHVNGDQLLSVREEIPQLFEASSYNIGVWHWELPELPREWSLSAAPLDEIWAPSAFVQSAASRRVTIPVVHMPHGIAVDEIEACPPEELGVPPGRFTFLCMFDLDSVLPRKNPLGAVEAFRRAFPGESAAALLVKAGHADTHPGEYAELKERLRGVPNVSLTDRMLPRPRVNGLLAACDGVVSLHRSEGFGLILAEAMALGKPVVATGWSGNMDFMNGENSCPVRYELVPLARDHASYGAGQEWAEPDVEHAAHLMRRLVEDSDLRNRLGERAKETIRTRFSPEAAGLRYLRRLAFLGLMDEK
jgi:glycosyltransferase involved in cell wall biosynthesis